LRLFGVCVFHIVPDKVQLVSVFLGEVLVQMSNYLPPSARQIEPRLDGEELQFILRQRLLEEDQKVPYYGRSPPTQKPTAEVLFDLFAGAMVNHVIEDGVVERRLAHLSDAALRVLDLLNVSLLLNVAVEVFTRVRKNSWCGCGDSMNVSPKLRHGQLPVLSLTVVVPVTTIAAAMASASV
jgi:hypothetical protein